jgi:hypothetical protein
MMAFNICAYTGMFTKYLSKFFSMGPRIKTGLILLLLLVLVLVLVLSGRLDEVSGNEREKENEDE